MEIQPTIDTSDEHLDKVYDYHVKDKRNLYDRGRDFESYREIFKHKVRATEPRYLVIDYVFNEAVMTDVRKEVQATIDANRERHEYRTGLKSSLGGRYWDFYHDNQPTVDFSYSQD